MATIDINTYDGLKLAVADYLNRADLTDQIPGFIRLAEAQFNRELRVRDMHIRAQAISQLEFVPYPHDFLQEYSLALNPDGKASQEPLHYIGKREADRLKAAQQSGPVGWYTSLGDAIELIPAPHENVALVMIYYGRIPALGSPLAGEPRQSNWLLAKSPDLYLASAILQAAPYLNDPARLQTWGNLRTEYMVGMTVESERAMRSTTQLTSRARAF